MISRSLDGERRDDVDDEVRMEGGGPSGLVTKDDEVLGRLSTSKERKGDAGGGSFRVVD